MIARRIVVAIPRMIASSAAISLDPVILANVLIIGLIVWKSGPPTIKGPDIVLNAAIKAYSGMPPYSSPPLSYDNPALVSHLSKTSYDLMFPRMS